MRSQIVLFFIIMVSWTSVFSQHLSQQVMVTAAGISVSGSVNYSQTVGETAIEIISSSGFVFTQGFQQPGIKISTETAPPGNGVDVYPNPATDYINVKFFGVGARNFKVEIYNLAGTLVSSGSVNFTESYHYIQRIAVNSFIKGFYFVRISSSDKLISRSFKIEIL
jgi:hypothetical protein